MTKLLILGWIAGMILAGIILVRARTPRTLHEDFWIGLAAIGWPLVAGAVFISVCCRLLWTEVIDKIIVLMRSGENAEEE